MQVRQSISSEEVLLEASTENGKFEVTPLEGKFMLVLSAAETSAIDWRRGKYDIELESPGGVVTRLLHGAIEVSREVTR